MSKKDESAAGKRSKSAEPKTAAAKKTAAPKTAMKKPAPAKAAAKKAPAKTAKPKTSAAAETKAPAKKSAAKKSAPAKSKKSTESETLEITAISFGPLEDDAVGDVSSGEAHRLIVDESEPPAMLEAHPADAEEGLLEIESEDEPAGEKEPREPRSEANLERLQKVLSQAGIASRRHAEEMITAGRVMVNGQVVTQLGAKADPERDHIRVDGKLIQGAERHRTFLLNKPKGFVTTVSDPEGRPTVMQFFEKQRERLYPVGRLDYLSEGLLLMTNDGELANAVTRAAAGVEKTYLVKVSGRPTEEALEQLRSGVRIDREQPGSGKVHTAPASVREVRTGDNPWFEVILTEGRNRELRKMFQAIGHFVEKIRRVGYGPLVLDVEPGNFRELTPEEINALRLTAEGKLKPRRPKSSGLIPREAGRPAEEWQNKRSGTRTERPRRDFRSRDDAGGRPGAPRREFRSREDAGGRPERPFRPREDRGTRPFEKREGRSFGRPGGFDKPRGSRPDRPQFDRPRGERPGGGEGRFDRPASDRPKFDRPRFDRPRPERPGFDRARPEGKTFDRPKFDRPKFERGEGGGERFNRPREDRGQFRERGFEGRPENRQRFSGRGPERRGDFSGRPRPDRPRFDKPRFDRPDRGPRQDAGTRSFSRPPREEGGKPAGPSREFRSREGGFERSDRPKRFDRPGGASFSRPPREEGGRDERPRREFRPREGGSERGERPNRFGPRPGGAQSFSRPPREGGRPAGGSRFNRGKSRPGGPRGNRPGGGPPRRDRG